MFAGVTIIIVLASITVTDVNAYGEQSLIALIAMGTLIFQHFIIRKKDEEAPTPPSLDDDDE